MAHCKKILYSVHIAKQYAESPRYGKPCSNFRHARKHASASLVQHCIINVLEFLYATSCIANGQGLIVQPQVGSLNLKLGNMCVIDRLLKSFTQHKHKKYQKHQSNSTYIAKNTVTTHIHLSRFPPSHGPRNDFVVKGAKGQ